MKSMKMKTTKQQPQKMPKIRTLKAPLSSQTASCRQTLKISGHFKPIITTSMKNYK
jgi:hypothetical protein